jgi:predicted CXXCH cytochrome family protein
MQCHDPHSQRNLFEVKDDLCINCHQQDMERYLEDTHVQKGIGCVDCHALVIPPEEIPNDGIVPTGHAFNITPATCVACHTDALHAGFSLPGFEDGPSSYNHTNGITETVSIDDSEAESTENEMMTAEQQVQTLQAALASRDITTLFQGGIVGIVLGSSTAWIVARNVRRSPGDETEEEENNEEKETETE